MAEQFEKLKSSFDDFHRQQNSNDSIQIESLFQNSLEIIVENIGSFHFYEDKKSQLLVIESPLSGEHCFEWNPRYKLFRSVDKEHYLPVFLSEEFMKVA